MTPEALLELQLTDSAIDLIRHRLPRLPEVVAAATAVAGVAEWEKKADLLRRQITSYEAAIASAEAANETIGKQRHRLDQQLKTVIAPREAEALMHEIALMNSRRSTLDDEELEAMENLATAEAGLSDHIALEAAVRLTADDARAAAAAATAASNEELAGRIAARDAMRASLDPSVRDRYDSMRSQHNGVAVAKLNGLRCEGCHLDLSRGEVDDIKRLPDDEMPECPNCGRLLVR